MSASFAALLHEEHRRRPVIAAVQARQWAFGVLFPNWPGCGGQVTVDAVLVAAERLALWSLHGSTPVPAGLEMPPAPAPWGPSFVEDGQPNRG